MMSMDQALLQAGLRDLGLSAEPSQLEQFQAYAALLTDWNTRMNLTAITDAEGIAVKHFLDSVLPLAYFSFPDGLRVADIGTGAGFPGLPLKIMRPDLKLTLVDSLNKRVVFLTEVCRQLGLEGVTCIHARAEELGRDRRHREAYDLVVSRAVANMTVLSEYCLPFVRVGGQLLALKAADIEDELRAAKPMIGNLGGAISGITNAPLPQSDIVRNLVAVEKRHPTPPQFPRTAKRIQKGSS